MPKPWDERSRSQVFPRCVPMSQLVSTPEINNAGKACPRCQQPLVDPNGLGWCKACGYCKSLAESEKTNAKAPPLPTEKAAPQNAVMATGSAIVQTPTWFWVSLVGVVLVSGATFACAHYLKFTPLQRALLTSGQMVVGAGVMFLGQFIGLLRIAPDESTLGFCDAVFPFRLYGMVMKHLPSTRHTVYLGVWGLTAIIAANIFIGGLPHLLTYLPKSQEKGPQIPKANSSKAPDR
jgi:hypothetical protein